MPVDYGYIFLFFLGGIFMVGAALATAFFLRPGNPTEEKILPYECGEDPLGSSYIPFNIRFYLAALVFVIFDVETVFLLPWAICFKELGITAFISMILFLVILFVGWAYAWRKGVFKWQ